MPKWVAEIGGNHGGLMHRCVSLAKLAAKAGCWGVKFQFIRESLFDDGVKRHKLFPVGAIPYVKHVCEAEGMALGFSLFRGIDAAFLKDNGADFLKISSYDLLRHDLIKACARTKLPLVISTGMASDAEVKAAAEAAKFTGCHDLYVLHCISQYPTPPVDCQLFRIHHLRCGVWTAKGGQPMFKVGYSDHSVSEAVMYRAAHSYHPDMIEFHLDDGKGEESKHSWRLPAVKRVIRMVANGELADGTRFRTMTPVEMAEREFRADPKTGLRKTAENETDDEADDSNPS